MIKKTRLANWRESQKKFKAYKKIMKTEKEIDVAAVLKDYKKKNKKLATKMKEKTVELQEKYNLKGGGAQLMFALIQQDPKKKKEFDDKMDKYNVEMNEFKKLQERELIGFKLGYHKNILGLIKKYQGLLNEKRGELGLSNKDKPLEIKLIGNSYSSSEEYEKKNDLKAYNKWVLSEKKLELTNSKEVDLKVIENKYRVQFLELDFEEFKKSLSKKGSTSKATGFLALMAGQKKKGDKLEKLTEEEHKKQLIKSISDANHEAKKKKMKYKEKKDLIKEKKLEEFDKVKIEFKRAVTRAEAELGL